MSDEESKAGQSERGGVRLGLAELVMAVFLAVLAAIVIKDSLRLGNGWASDGPQAGYFPFYIGSILMFCAALIALQSFMHRASLRSWFATGLQLRRVLQVFVPMALFVVALMFIGLYLAAVIYIAMFMRWQGKFGWPLCLAVGIATALVLFGLFELWFHVPLPKGPIEQWLGY